MNGRTDSFNRMQRQRAANDAAVIKALARLRAGKSVRSGNKFATARGERIDGFYFQSGKEARRYEMLKLLRAANLISSLVVHPAWSIIIADKLICKVVCDFSYWDIPKANMIVEDVKKETRGRDGKVTFTTNTDLSKIKQRLMLAIHGIEIVLVK